MAASNPTSGAANSNVNPSNNNTPQGAQTTPAISPTTTTTAVCAPNNSVNGHDSLATQQALKHDPGITLDWSAEEQATLEDGLLKFANESSINKYIKIAALLAEKTVRDVALRYRWMLKRENGKRRKAEEQNLVKKIKDRKEKSLDSTAKPPVARSPLPLYTLPSLPGDNDDGISNEAIGGTTGQLLEQNYQVIAQIRANFASYKLQENTDLLARFRDNIFAILNGMKDMPGIMSQMPPLPVKMNSELADSILPKHVPQTSMPFSSCKSEK